jgi:uncharacterized membrane protein
MVSLSNKADHPRRKVKSIKPDFFERILAFGVVGMLGVVLVAMVRGRAEWANLTAQLWVHLITIVAALALTPALLLQKRGTQLHRQLGWAWATAMITTAVVSLFVHETGTGFSPIHLLSVITIIGVPLTIWAARRHKVAAHRLGIRLAVTGALLIAGFFTFPFGRMMGRWLFG